VAVCTGVEEEGKGEGGSTPAFKERRRKRETTVGVESNGH
jgi:hypothetical protein